MISNNPLPALLQIPAYRGKCDASEESIEGYLSHREMDTLTRDIQERLLELANHIAQKYEHLKSPTHQVIEVDWTVIDQSPETAEFRYKIVTKREIREGKWVEPEVLNEL